MTKWIRSCLNTLSFSTSLVVTERCKRGRALIGIALLMLVYYVAAMCAIISRRVTILAYHGNLTDTNLLEGL
jgi:hypothetical protein